MYSKKRINTPRKRGKKSLSVDFCMCDLKCQCDQ